MQNGSGQSSSLGLPRSDAPANIKPSNMVYISRPDKDIRDTWVIDPEMNLKDRRGTWNLDLSTKGATSIQAEVFVLPSTMSPEEESPKVMINLGGDHSLSLKLFEACPGSPRRFFHLVLVGGPISISVPRTFHGTVKLQAPHKSIDFSDAMKANFTTFSEVEGTTNGFLGNFNYHQWKGSDLWKGDTLQVIVMREEMLTLRYNDEIIEKERSCTCLCM